MLACSLVLAGASGVSRAADCPGNPTALGISRVLTVDPKLHPLVGVHDYGQPLPLARGEVVLTFDDGPLPPATHQVLRTLAGECVKAVFFLVGRRANAHPAMVREIHAAGHTIGTHTQTHPLHHMSPGYAQWEIDRGVASVAAALGRPQDVAPFFRFPGLFHTPHAHAHLRARSMAAWSIDIDSDDWRKIGPDNVLHRTLARLDRRGRGILLMHDIHGKTAHILPTLLAELKKRRYRVVHVVSAGTPQPSPPKQSPDVVATPQPVAPVQSTGSVSPVQARQAAAPASARPGPPVQPAPPSRPVAASMPSPHPAQSHQHRRPAPPVDEAPRRRAETAYRPPEFRWSP